jgi:hypothetical protein
LSIFSIGSLELFSRAGLESLFFCWLPTE